MHHSTEGPFGLNSIAPATVSSKRPLFVALVTSVLAHALMAPTIGDLLINIQPTADAASTPTPSLPPSLHFRLRNPTPEDAGKTALHRKDGAAKTTPDSGLIPTPAPTAKLVDEEPKPTIHASNNPDNPSSEATGPAGHAGPSTTLITTLPPSGVAAFGEPPVACDQRQRASAVRRCNPEPDSVALAMKPERFSEAFTSAFQELRQNSSFKRDMARAETLLAQHAQLDTLAAQQGSDLAFIRSQQRHLTEELHRIDRRYASGDLLKVLASGGKAGKKVADLIAEKVKR